MLIAAAQEAVTVDPWVSLLIGALGASVVGGIGAVIASFIQSKREHGKWLRERRLEAYIAFLRVVESTPRLSAEMVMDAATLSYPSRLNDALADLSLLGPGKVYDAGSVLMIHAVSANLGSSILGDLNESKEDAKKRKAKEARLQAAKELFNEAAQAALKIKPGPKSAEVKKFLEKWGIDSGDKATATAKR